MVLRKVAGGRRQGSDKEREKGRIGDGETERRRDEGTAGSQAGNRRTLRLKTDYRYSVKKMKLYSDYEKIYKNIITCYFDNFVLL